MQPTDFMDGMRQTQDQTIAALGLTLLAALMLELASKDADHGRAIMERFEEYRSIFTKAASASTPIEYFMSVYNGSEQQDDTIEAVVKYLNSIMEGESDAS